jgi:hypothetical protein
MSADLIASLRSTIEAKDSLIAAQRDNIAAKAALIDDLRAQVAETLRTLSEGAQTLALARAIIGADRARRAEVKP